MNYIIQKSGIAVYKEKRSEFIAHTFHLNSSVELNDILKSLKIKYPNARHFCWAYKIFQNDKFVENYSDAGEPNGSAGIPILNSIRSNQLVNCAIVVVRKFGGVKLGKKGLINSYQQAADLAIAESGLNQWEQLLRFDLRCDINFYGAITQSIEKFGGQIIADSSGKRLKMSVVIKKQDREAFIKQFNEVSKNSGAIKKQSEHDQTKEVRK